MIIIIWNIGYQYNNFNMPDNFRRAMSALASGTYLVHSPLQSFMSYLRSESL